MHAEVVDFEPLESIIARSSPIYIGGGKSREGDLRICEAPEELRRMCSARGILTGINKAVGGFQHTVNLQRLQILNGRIALRIMELASVEHLELLKTRPLKKFKVTNNNWLVYRE